MWEELVLEMDNPYLHKGHLGHFLNTVICKWFFLTNSLSIVMIIFRYVQNWQHYSRIFSLSFSSLVSTFTRIISLSGKVPGYFQTFQSLVLYPIFSFTLDRMKIFQNRFMNQGFSKHCVISWPISDAAFLFCPQYFLH